MDKKYKILIAILLTVSILLLIGFVVWLCFFRRNNNVLQSTSTYNIKPVEKLIVPTKKDTEELVVAVCNEDVYWVDNYAKHVKLVTVYNKCGRILKFKSPNVKVIETPNIGSCDYAYLSYIIDRYDTLPDFIEFTKGWVEPTREYHNCLPCKEQVTLNLMI